MYRLMNSMDSLLRFEGLAKGNSPRIQEEPQMGFFPQLKD
jgi:hypothetical protein